MKALVKILKGRDVISTDVIKQIGPESEASELKLVNDTAMVHGYGANIRCRSDRTETLLSWKPKARGLIETLPDVVDLLLSREQSL